MSAEEKRCDCHSCELGDPAMCYGCPVHGAWCDWFGEGPNCQQFRSGPFGGAVSSGTAEREAIAEVVEQVFKRQGQAPRYSMLIAEAVVEALGLTEEWGVITDMGVYTPASEERAKQAAERWPDMTARWRLVGPWRTAEEDKR